MEHDITKMKAELSTIKDNGAEFQNYRDKPTMQEVTLLIEDKTKHLNEKTWADIAAKNIESKFGEISSDIGKVKEVLEDTKVKVEETKMKADEERDKESRSNNIIIYRVPEAESREERLKQDSLFCKQLINDALDIDVDDSDIKSIFRLGKKGDAVRPLLIQLREKVIKNRVMESLFKLKRADEKFRNISVTHDMTRQERLESKKLIAEAKEKQEQESGEYIWRVRGAPGLMRIIRLRK